MRALIAAGLCLFLLLGTSGCEPPAATPVATVYQPNLDALDKTRAAEAALRDGDHPGALELATAAAKLDPAYPPAQVARASALLRLGQFSEAARALGEATTARPDFAEGHLYRAMLLERAGDTAGGYAAAEEARRAISAQIDAGALGPDKQMHLAMAEYLLYGPAPAVKRLNALLEARPDYVPADRLLRQVLEGDRSSFIAQFSMYTGHDTASEPMPAPAEGEGHA